MKHLASLSFLTVLFFSACAHTPPPPPPIPDMPQFEGTVPPDSFVPPDDEEEMATDRSFPNKIIMTNVSDMPDAQGEGWYGVMEGETRVYANFLIDDPAEGYFYEGWLVCEGEAYTTGALIKFEGLYENFFISSDVPEICDQYVLTIEPDDGDPAPADHVMDGVMEGVAHTEPAMDWHDERFETMFESL